MLWFPRFLAFASGFISLSLEILWVRYAAFAYRGGRPSVAVNRSFVNR